MKKCIVVATLHEAMPIINRLSLKSCNTRFDTYQSDEYILIISGIGKLNASIATTHILSTNDIDMMINIGIAGSKSKAINNLYLINKITDNSMQKDFFPDILLHHHISECSITTYDKPITTSDMVDDNLVDMECSGYYFASSKFLPPHKIMSLKIVSDNLTPNIITKEYVQAIIIHHIDDIVEFLHTYSFTTDKILTDDEMILINKISSNLNLSFNTNLQLIDKAKYLKLNNNLNRLIQYENIKVEQKNEQQKIFYAIKQL